MKLTYLGTAAAEGFPAVFCRCPHCREAARLGGRNIRTRSQALVNDDLLIDLPADTYSHFLQNGIEGDRIRHLLVTHTHSDHFYGEELEMRHGAFAREMRVPELEVLASAESCRRMGKPPLGVAVTVAEPYKTVRLGAYEVTPLPARHMPGGGALIYIIRGDKTLLYAHDTGYPFAEVLSYIKREGLRFDMVSLDCTNVDIPISDEGSHMGFPNVGRLLAVLGEMGAVDRDTVKYVNHFSHNGSPLHAALEARAAEYGCRVAYDGCTVNI